MSESRSKYKTVTIRQDYAYGERRDATDEEVRQQIFKAGADALANYVDDMMQIYTIRIPRLPPAEMSPNARGHWSTKHKATDDAHQEIWAIVHEKGKEVAKPHVPLASAIVTITWRCDRRRRDFDNMLARAKPYMDSLVKEGFLADDSNKVIREYKMKFEYAKVEETVIEIMEAP